MSFRSYDLLRLVQDFGETLTLRKLTTTGTYSPSTGTVTGSATTDYTFTGYLYNDTRGILTEADNTVRVLKKCAIPALGFNVEPDSDDLIVKGSLVLKITSVETSYSDGVAVCYICYVRE